MKIIRKGTFETNSSSTHSYTVSNYGSVYETLYPDANGVITIKGNDFGWEFEKYDDAASKVSYVATLINECLESLEDISINNTWVKKYIPDSLFDGDKPVIKDKIKLLFESVIKDHTGCNEIVYETEDCYVDHQSWDSGCDILGFTYEEMKNFLFNPGSTLYTGNDNSTLVWDNGQLVDSSDLEDDED